MALTKIDDRGLKTPIDLLDNEKIRFGTGNDLQIYHDGSNSWIKDTGIGSLYIDATNVFIRDSAGNENLANFREHGACNLYYDSVVKLSTDNSGVLFYQHAMFGDNDKALFGTGHDLQIYHDGTNSVMDNTTGDLYIKSVGGVFITPGTTEAGVYIRHNAQVELYYDNSKKLETFASGVSVDGELHVGSHLVMGDNDNIKLGAGSDLQIYHDGSHSYINESGTGNLRIKSDNAVLLETDNFTVNNEANSENLLIANNGGAVDLYYDGVKKFETTSGGAKISGDLEVNTANNSDNHAIANFSGTDVGNAASFFMRYYTCGSDDNRTGFYFQHENVGNMRMWMGDDSKLRSKASNPTSGNDGNAFVQENVGANNIKMNNGQGIDFSATSGTGTSELLDDYEEGTWTPSNSTSGFEAGSSLGGSYTKIGNRVFFDFRVRFDTNSSGVSAYIDGFPFTSAGGGGDHDHGASITYTNSSENLTFLIGDGGSRIYIYLTTGSQPNHAQLSNDYVRAQGQVTV